MKGQAGIDYPEEREAVDVQAAGRDDLVQSFVERVDERVLVLTVGEDRTRRRVRLEPGEQLELIWRGPGEMRVLPTELVGVQPSGSRPTWEVRPTGPAGTGQRRSAVRAAFTFAVALRIGQVEVEATGVDLSETGLRCWLPLASLAGASGEDGGSTAAAGPAEGTAVVATVHLGSHEVPADAAVVRQRTGEGDRLELSLKFVDLDDRLADAVRRRVFAELRESRARELR
ncbi:PilZ domain-containing protein [Blastococcus sp. SYSU D00669]